ncbi:hypothetical protein RD792_007208 [Penstemon davidsonii]|uniref:VQ domain-containing protein n=1 Tax=Penstemon davidsonii TaxID=160366 RepID=A0ABR0D6G9_9LAMI|nr:hypothetical protein RD792_007208 [Penstemon davidsonii]
MAAAGNNNRKPVKVVIINTQYVETDAMSFKSVVQKLTGNCKLDDSTVMNCNNRFESPADDGTFCNKSSTASVLSRGMSFREFDMMLKELPPLDELYSLYADY